MSAPHTWQQFLMGHKGDVEATYTTVKDLQAEKIEEARQVFRDVVEPKLSTQPMRGGLQEALVDRDRRLQELEQQLASVMRLLDQLVVGRELAAA